MGQTQIKIFWVLNIKFAILSFHECARWENYKIQRKTFKKSSRSFSIPDFIAWQNLYNKLFFFNSYIMSNSKTQSDGRPKMTAKTCRHHEISILIITFHNNFTRIIRGNHIFIGTYSPDNKDLVVMLQTKKNISNFTCSFLPKDSRKNVQTILRFRSFIFSCWNPESKSEIISMEMIFKYSKN